jgi:hypothetical protein
VETPTPRRAHATSTHMCLIVGRLLLLVLILGREGKGKAEHVSWSSDMWLPHMIVNETSKHK